MASGPGQKEGAAGRSLRQAETGQAPSVAALVLAAGLSRRMAPDNKLLVRDPDGHAMVARAAAAACASAASHVLVVTGHQADAVAASLSNLRVTLVHAADYKAGLAASLRAGVAAVPAGASAVIICLGDMPLVTHAMIDQVIAAYDPAAGRTIVVPAYRGTRGNPVLWDRRFFPDLLALTGDTGARFLLQRYAGQAGTVEIGSDAILTDVDTPAAFERLIAGQVSEAWVGCAAHPEPPVDSWGDA